MAKNRNARNTIIWQTLLFLVLLMPPVLSLFNRPASILGIPVLFAYIFISWLLYIVFTALLIRKTDN